MPPSVHLAKVEDDLDLDWLRNWTQSNPRIQEEARAVMFAAMDSFERLRQENIVRPKQLQPIITATRSPWQASRSLGCRLLCNLARSCRTAQEALRELWTAGKAKDRLAVTLDLSTPMPRPLLQELLDQGIRDRSKKVRLWAAERCNQLMFQELVPALRRQAEVESDWEVKRTLERCVGFIEHGYWIERSGGGRLTLLVRLPKGGHTWQDIRQRDVDRGGVPAIIAKLRTHFE
jgi:hypothetical protein